jgi:hypothetical protein
LSLRACARRDRNGGHERNCRKRQFEHPHFELPHVLALSTELAANLCVDQPQIIIVDIAVDLRVLGSRPVPIGPITLDTGDPVFLAGLNIDVVSGDAIVTP